MDKEFAQYVKRIVTKLDCSNIEKIELEEEFLNHLQLLKEEAMQNGATEPQATKLAIEQFGDETAITSGLQASISPYRKAFRFLLWSVFSLWSFLVFVQLIGIRIIDRIINWNNFNFYFRYPNGTTSFWDLQVWEINSNIVPFKSIFMYATGIESYNLSIILQNTIGTALLFVPVGIGIALLATRRYPLGKVAGYTFGGSLLIEGIQFFLQIGRFDIDDCLMYTIGVLSGYMFVNFLKDQRSKKQIRHSQAVKI